MRLLLATLKLRTRSFVAFNRKHLVARDASFLGVEVCVAKLTLERIDALLASPSWEHYCIFIALIWDSLSPILHGLEFLRITLLLSTRLEFKLVYNRVGE